MESEKNEISTEQALIAIEKEKRIRSEAAASEIKAILDKHKCIIDASVTLRLNQVIPNIMIVAN